MSSSVQWVSGLWQVRTGSGNTLQVPVRILEEKMAYGRTRYRIEPVGGAGRAWVDDEKVVSLSRYSWSARGLDATDAEAVMPPTGQER